jgi:hypothetical protein
LLEVADLPGHFGPLIDEIDQLAVDAVYLRPQSRQARRPLPFCRRLSL